MSKRHLDLVWERFKGHVRDECWQCHNEDLDLCPRGRELLNAVIQVEQAEVAREKARQ